jgi:hypothetical protein
MLYVWWAWGNSREGLKALVTLKTVCLEVRACWEARCRGKSWREGLSRRDGHYQPLPISLPLAMEERARMDIIFY